MSGTVITFYSYKGGVGRTLALANVGTLLSIWGYRVLCVDWDLEAPGLHCYFERWLSVSPSEGLVEIIAEHAAGQVTDWSRRVQKVTFHQETALGASLDFLAAGRFDAQYVERLQALNWDVLYRNSQFGEWLEGLRASWKEAYDFVLIDSRTGFTDLGGICTIQLPDILILLFTASQQSLDGILDVARRASERQGHLPFDRARLPCVPVPTRFEARVELKIAKEWLKTFSTCLRDLYQDWLAANIEPRELLDILRIPYVPYWSFGEKMPVLDEGIRDPESLGFSFATLAALLAHGLDQTELLVTKRDDFVRRAIRKVEDIGSDQIPRLFQSGQPLTPSALGLFHGREDIIGKIRGSFFGGIQRERFYLDGIRRVGKTSLLNFLPLHLHDDVFPVFVNLDTFGLRGSIRSAEVLRRICVLVKESIERLSGMQEISLPEPSQFEDSPGQVFSDFLSSIKSAFGGRVPLIMIDEFQELLYATARSGSSQDRDTLVLDQLRGHSDVGNIYVIFTGSIRFDGLSSITDHRIFGSLTRLRISFLSKDSVGAVLRAGMDAWASILPEAVSRVFDLTGGYPWLVQVYGAGIVDKLNKERRLTATPDDVDFITTESVLCNNEMFAFWWPTDQLGAEEERLVESLFRRYPGGGAVSTREFFSAIDKRELPSFRRAFENLRACEVLDSTQVDVLRFRGDVLRQWLQQKVQDGQLTIRGSSVETVQRHDTGIFVDHERLVKCLERISRERGVDTQTDRLAWFSRILAHLIEGAERRMGKVRNKIAVAFWDRPSEADLLPAYFKQGFAAVAPEPVKMQNAVDFKVASEVRRLKEQVIREGSRLERAIIVSGDGDLSHEVRALINDGLAVEIWGGSRETSMIYREIVGADNIIFLDDIGGI